MTNENILLAAADSRKELFSPESLSWSVTHQTRPFGLVSFAGFDASGGVTVGVTLPRGYRGYSLDSCAGSPGTVSLQPDDFHFGYASVQFGAEILGEVAGP